MTKRLARPEHVRAASLTLFARLGGSGTAAAIGTLLPDEEHLSSGFGGASGFEDCLLHDSSERFCGSMALTGRDAKTGFRHKVRSQSSRTRRQDDAQDPRATHNRRANDGAREQCTGLRHRPEKGGEGATPARRSKSVASAPNPRTEAIAHTYYTGSPRRHAKKLPRRRRRVPPDVLRAMAVSQ